MAGRQLEHPCALSIRAHCANRALTSFINSGAGWWVVLSCCPDSAAFCALAILQNIRLLEWQIVCSAWDKLLVMPMCCGGYHGMQHCCGTTAATANRPGGGGMQSSSEHGNLLVVTQCYKINFCQQALLCTCAASGTGGSLCLDVPCPDGMISGLRCVLLLHVFDVELANNKQTNRRVARSTLTTFSSWWHARTCSARLRA